MQLDLLFYIYGITVFTRKLTLLSGKFAEELNLTQVIALLDATNGNFRAVQKLSRHKNIQVLGIYDDNRISPSAGIVGNVR